VVGVRAANMATHVVLVPLAANVLSSTISRLAIGLVGDGRGGEERLVRVPKKSDSSAFMYCISVIMP